MQRCTPYRLSSVHRVRQRGHGQPMARVPAIEFRRHRVAEQHHAAQIERDAVSIVSVCIIVTVILIHNPLGRQGRVPHVRRSPHVAVVLGRRRRPPAASCGEKRASAIADQLSRDCSRAGHALSRRYRARRNASGECGNGSSRGIDVAPQIDEGEASSRFQRVPPVLVLLLLFVVIRNAPLVPENRADRWRRCRR